MFAFLALLASAPTTAPIMCAATLEQGRQAYGTYDVDTARRNFTSVVNGSCGPDEIAEAATELARIAWLVGGNDKEAVERIRLALTKGSSPCGPVRLLGRILNKAGEAERSSLELLPLVAPCAQQEPAIALERADALMRIALGKPPALRKTSLKKARMALDNAPEVARASMQGAALRLSIGLIAREAEEALSGWRDFYWLSGTNAPQAFDQSDVEIRLRFIEGLRQDAKADAKLALVGLLIRGGFDGDAERLFVTIPKSSASQWRSAAAYFDMRQRVQALLLHHDRAYALGERRSEDALEIDLLKILRGSVAAADMPSDDPWPAMRALWGLVGTTGKSNGVSGLHLGHVSVDTEQTITQGRRTGKVRFVALDNMIANGFAGWLGNGTT